MIALVLFSAALWLLSQPISALETKFEVKANSTNQTCSFAASNSVCTQLNLCENGGSCFIYGQTYACKCSVGFTGEKCETKLTPCHPNPCNHTCEVLNSFQFLCIENAKNEITTATRTPSLPPRPRFNSPDCQGQNYCLNGGVCHIGYRNPDNLVYICFCPKGFAGLKCELTYSFGYESEAIFKSLQISKDVDRNGTTNKFVYFPYRHLPGFGRSFILSHTEITREATVTRVEFHVATPGYFMVSFIKFPDCPNKSMNSCAEFMKTYRERINRHLEGGYDHLVYEQSSELVELLKGKSYLMHGRFGFNRFDLPEQVQTVKGTLITVTQIDGYLGGLMTYYYDYSNATDVQLKVGYLHDQINTDQLQVHDYQFGANLTVFYSVVVSDMRVVNRTIETLLNFTRPEGHECVNSFCMNGGKCDYDKESCGYKCICPAATTGKYCQIKSRAVKLLIN